MTAEEEMLAARHDCGSCDGAAARKYSQFEVTATNFSPRQPTQRAEVCFPSPNSSVTRATVAAAGQTWSAKYKFRPYPVWTRSARSVSLSVAVRHRHVTFKMSVALTDY